METVLKVSMPITKDDTGHLLDLRFESLRLSKSQFMSHWRFRPINWAATEDNFQRWSEYVNFVNRLLGIKRKPEELYNLARGIQVDFDDPEMRKIAEQFLTLDRQADKEQEEEGPGEELRVAWVLKNCKFASDDIDFWINKLNSAYMELYGMPLSSDAEAHYRSKGIPSLQAQCEYLQQNKEKIFREQKLEQHERELSAQKESDAIVTSLDTYYRVSGNAERIVCDAPDLHKKGMPAYNLNETDPDLTGYYAIHTGNADEWLPILVRDQYCNGTAYVYQILCEQSLKPFYEMEDCHVADKTDAPYSAIIFSKYKTIPPQLIRLVKVIKNPKAAKDIY